MTLSDVAIKRPVFTAMMSLTLIVIGLMGYSRLGTDLFPDVSFPFVTVTTIYPGAGPGDIEQQVTRHIEDAVASIPGVDRAFSQSRESVSFVFVQFKMKVPIGEAVQNVRDRVGSAIPLLPRGIDPPLIAQFDIGAQPVIIFSATTGQDSLSLRELLDDKVRPRLEQIEGVAAARVVGGGKREVSVELFPDRMEALGLTPDAVFQRIRAEHLDLPAGRYSAGPSEVGVRVRGEMKNADELRSMVVKTNMDGSHVRLSDVALVREVMAETRTLVRTNGKDAVAMEVVKGSGANTVAVSKKVKATLDELRKEIPDLHTDMLVDSSLDIEANAHEVWIAIFFGGAMAILIILFFLLDLRGTIISAMALPTSVIGTLFAMYALGYSLNQLTLLGLSLAIGLLIDDAVVVRESINKRLEAGETPESAASGGTREIALAVLATTFSLVAVFVPVAFMSGMVGQFFRQFGLTITAAVLISLFVAFTLDPMLSARFALQRKPGEDHHGAVAKVFLRGFQAMDRLYARSLEFVLRWRKLTTLLVTAVFFGSLGIGAALGSDFVPPEDRGQVLVEIKLPPGTRIETTSARSAEFEKRVLELPGVTTVYAIIGPGGEVNKMAWRVIAVPKNERTLKLDDYKTMLRKLLVEMPQAEVAVTDPPVIEGLGSFPPILMQIIGPDFDVLRDEARKMAEILRSIPGTADVQIIDSPGQPELELQVNRDEASRLGLPAALVAMQVRLATNGEIAGKIRQGRHESEIRVRLAGEDRSSPEALGRQKITGPLGAVSLSQLVSFDRATSPSIIERESRERQISVSAQIGPGSDIGSVVSAMHERIDPIRPPAGYSYFWNGQQRDFADMGTSLAIAMGLALVFIFMVLASQFESLLHPFTIMISLPLALVGAILGLAVTGNKLGMGANIGVILLMGLVTKNAILLVDGALQQIRDHGATAIEAMRWAGPRRLRPILMTSAAMAIGMLPTALGKGTGSEFRAPMAIAVIGGVITSTLLTLWVVPIVFIWVERFRGLFSRAPKADVAPVAAQPTT